MPEAMATKLFGVTFLAWLWYFVIGVFWSRMWKQVPHHGGLAALGFAAYVAIAAVRYFEPGDYYPLLTGLAAVPLSYSLVWFGNYGPKALARLTARLGDLSFGTYVWHMVVVNFLIYFGAREWSIPGTAKVALVAVVSMILAVISWRFVERPALSLKKYSSARVIRKEMTQAAEASPSLGSAEVAGHGPR